MGRHPRMRSFALLSTHDCSSWVPRPSWLNIQGSLCFQLLLYIYFQIWVCSLLETGLHPKYPENCCISKFCHYSNFSEISILIMLDGRYYRTPRVCLLASSSRQGEILIGNFTTTIQNLQKYAKIFKINAN